MEFVFCDFHTPADGHRRSDRSHTRNLHSGRPPSPGKPSPRAQVRGGKGKRIRRGARRSSRARQRAAAGGRGAVRAAPHHRCRPPGARRAALRPITRSQRRPATPHTPQAWPLPPPPRVLPAPPQRQPLCSCRTAHPARRRRHCPTACAANCHSRRSHLAADAPRPPPPGSPCRHGRPQDSRRPRAAAAAPRVAAARVQRRLGARPAARGVAERRDAGRQGAPRRRRAAAQGGWCASLCYH